MASRSARAAAWVTAEEAIAAVPPRATIYVEGGPPHPNALAAALVERAPDIAPINIVTSLMGPVPAYCGVDAGQYFHIRSFRGSREVRDAIRAGQVDIVPTHLSAIPGLLSGPLRADVALIQVAPPDEQGNCSLGMSVLYHKAAIAAASLVIAEVNPRMPRTHGDSSVPLSQIDYLVAVDRPLITTTPHQPSEAERQVADQVMEYIPDGATVEIGMGGLADAIMERLRQRRNQRVHSGLLSDGIIGLAKSGALVDAPGAIVSAAFFGSEALYDFIADNPQVALHPVDYTHNLDVIRAIPSFIAVNSALEVDLSGQVNAESIGGLPISGSGGTLDFVRGALLSRGGATLVALTAATPGEKHSRIVARLNEPPTVTTARTDVNFVVTEFGAADLRGKGLADRRRALIEIAHPRFRESLASGGTNDG